MGLVFRYFRDSKNKCEYVDFSILQLLRLAGVERFFKICDLNDSIKPFPM